LTLQQINLEEFSLFPFALPLSPLVSRLINGKVLIPHRKSSKSVIDK
jgi:hypothetical protein